MREPKESKSAVDGENRTSEQQKSKPGMEGLSRRTFLGVGSATLASAALASLAVNAQERVDTEKAEQDHSGRQNAAYGRQLSRAALAHSGRVGFHAVRKCSRDLS